jgi:choline dehydrogenase-like flavoprotein
MSPEARERYLLGWAHSRFAQRRSAFQALKRLLTFIAYADPGTALPNPLLARIGYHPDQPPVSDELTTITPHRIPAPDGHAEGADASVTLEADVVIVGSGAGGGVMADALSSAGRSVVVLEAGPFVDEATLPTNELDAFDRLYLNHGLVTTWDGSVTMLAGSAVGGATLVNWMTAIPAPEPVRRDWATDHGLDGVDGAEWTADVEALETELSVSESTRIPPKDAILLRGARALGWEAAPTRRNATQCGDCGSCPFGCPRGTKQSGIRVHLARAAAAGARIVPDATVTRVLIEAGRATGVEATATGGRRLIVRAPVVIMAAGALRSPAILEASGLGHPAIGRHLQIHPVTVVAGRYTESVEMWRGTMQAARSLEFVDADGERNGYVIESAPGHPGLLALAFPWEGTSAHERAMASSAHLAPLIAVTRDGGEGRVTTTKAGRVRLDYRLDDRGVATLRHALVRMARLARAAGATEIMAAATPPVWYSPSGMPRSEEAARVTRFEGELERFDFSPNRGTVLTAHQMGTVRMGASPKDHACDPRGRVRIGGKNDAVIGGLYVSDTSLFPSGIGVNPMITVMALARRVARTVLAET